ncbi:MAG: ABC transporter permease [Anaerolineae bacterium]|nr:ABC transporter permease [Anaerolineae bacterium]
MRSQPLTQPARVTRRQTPNALLRLAPLLSLLIALIGWHALALRYPPFILPGPVLVLERLTQRALDGSLVQHAGVTLSQALLGLLMGAGAALMLGVPIAKSPLADRLLSPFVVASQGIPFVAVAPLIFIWFGNGPLAKALVCALVVFFPMTINLVAGLRSAPLVLRDLFRALRATPLETFLKLELPSAIPFVFAGLRVSVTLSMVGAIAGEFLSASSGLGFLINLGNGTYDTPLVMASVLVTVLLSLSLYGLVRLSERAWSRYA